MIPVHSRAGVPRTRRPEHEIPAVFPAGVTRRSSFRDPRIPGVPPPAAIAHQQADPLPPDPTTPETAHIPGVPLPAASAVPIPRPAPRSARPARPPHTIHGRQAAPPPTAVHPPVRLPVLPPARLPRCPVPRRIPRRDRPPRTPPPGAFRLPGAVRDRSRTAAEH